MKKKFTAKQLDSGLRLDKVLVQHFAGRTRQYFQKILKEDAVMVNGKKVKASSTLKIGDKVVVTFPPLKELILEAKDIPLDIVHEDKNLLVLNKPPGIVVHPGTHGSHMNDSLVNALLHHCDGSLSGINGTMRPGIVHRLDKDTSGLLIVAKNDWAQQELSDQFKNHEVEKTYFALLIGHLTPGEGTIEAPIGRDSFNRKKMAVSQDGKMATTHYKVMTYYEGYTLVEIKLVTGRTHQIRVHFASIFFPLVGDQTYGRAKMNHFFEKEYGLKRQFLHAGKIRFTLPGSTKKTDFVVALTDDLQYVLDHLKLTR